MKILSVLTAIFAPRKKKLRATTTRRATAAGSDFDDMSEPNMKLSRALLVVLLLHVVAVAGIIAFNAIKSHQATTPPAVASKAQPSATPHAKPQPFVQAKAEKQPKMVSTDATKFYTVAKGDTPATIAKKFKISQSELLSANHIEDARKLQVGQKLVIPPRKTKKT